MSATVAVPRQPHALIERRGPRPSSLHAALPEGAAWATACGEHLTDGPRGTMHALVPAEAWALVHADSPRLCRRCSRVGDTVDA